MPRLLILQDYLRHGGTESHAVWLATAFAREGIETAVLTFRPDGPLAGRAWAAGVPPVALQKKDTGADWFTPGLSRALRDLAPEAVLLTGRMANARAGTVRKALPGVFLAGSVRTGRPLPWYVRRALPIGDAIVCNSRRIAATLPGFGVSERKITVISNPPSTPPLAADPELRRRVRAAQGARESDRVLLCVAGFRPGKGQEVLIRALSRTPDSSGLALWFAGDGATRPVCEKLVRTLRLGSRVKFLGHVADPRELCLAADLAVLASGAEALPNCLVEAQLHGLPVVAADAGGVKETFLPGETGLLTPAGDEAALAAAWTELAEDPARLSRFAAKALAWAPAVFSENAALAAYRRVFGF